jgi:hypothetical protein
MKLEKVHRVVSHMLGELPIQENEATFIPAGVKRKEIAGDIPENNGYTESYTFAELKIKLNAIYSDKFSIESLSNIEEDTLHIITTGGNEYMMPKAWATEPGKLSDGEIDIIFKSGSSPRLK